MNKEVMDKLEYCRQKAAPAGSSLYYSILYQRQSDKQNLYVLHAFHNALTGVISECSDPGIAHVKFAWWQEELQRLSNGQPRHPVTQAMLEQALPQKSLFLLGQIIEHYDNHVDLRQPVNYAQLIDFLQEGPGRFWQLLADCTGHEHPDTPSIIGSLGARFAYFDILQEQHRHTQLHRYYYPQEEAEKAADRATLYQMQIHRLEQELAVLADELPRRDYTSQRHALVLARIITHTCRESRRAGCDLLRQRVSLTPLKKLWIAWHCKIHYR